MSEAKNDAKTVRIGKRRVGPGRPVFIVFEAGPTHDGLKTAKALVDAAVKAGADAVKFQIINADRLIADRTMLFQYEVLVNKVSGTTEQVREPLYDILKRRELSALEWMELITYCRDKGIEFFSTATNTEEMDFLVEQGVGTVKICSGDITCHQLLKEAARRPWVVQLDTGNATIGEVERAVEVLEGEGCSDIVVNHCPSGYPALLESINLRVLTTLKQMFDYPVAFSDHTPGRDMDVAATALGVSMLEKTITLDRTIRSPEHIMSLEPDEGADFVRAIRQVETAMGNSRRFMSAEERGRGGQVRRSCYAGQEISQGAVLEQSMIDYARPEDGIPADLVWMILGKKARRRIERGKKIELQDLSD